MRLSDLKTGEKGIILGIIKPKIDSYNRHGEGFYKRLSEMGFIYGQEVEVILNAPLKDPVKYKIMGYEVSLRHSEADLIKVEAINDSTITSNANSCETLLEDKQQRSRVHKKNTINVALVGNPNAGKSSLFNIAANAHAHVGNYSGVTVGVAEGTFKQGNYTFKISDLPGTYSLSAYTPEELFVRKHLVEKQPDVIINVVDASNLERNLYLTTQLIDMNTRVVIALNMYDEFTAKGNKLDYVALSKMIGIPIVPTVARKGAGIEELFDVVIKLYEEYTTFDKDETFEKDITSIDKTAKHVHINYGKEIERSIAKLQEEIAKNTEIRNQYSTRYLSIKLLERDKEVEKIIRTLTNAEQIFEIQKHECKRVEKLRAEDTETSITNARYGFIAGALKKTLQERNDETVAQTKIIDSFVTHKLWGFPIFLFFMWLMFEATFTLGEYPKEWIETGVGHLGDWIGNMMSDGPLKDLLTDGIISGVGEVIVFLPNILILFLFISFLEDTGYMARAAFIMDKLMHKVGLNGKSFIPLVMGFGCNVPAIMATRTIEARSSRMITMLVSPFISCSARLPIYILLISAFFPNNASLVLFSIYIFGIIVAVVMAKIFRIFFFTKDETPFVMELPPYRLPTLKAVIRHMWDKGEQYLKKMGTIILVASIIIWFLGYFPRDIKYSQNYDDMIATTEANYTESIKEITDTAVIASLTEDYEEEMAIYEASKRMEHQEKSYIGRIGKFIEPVIKPLGFDWKIGIAIVAGIPAKEIVVSTLSVLYTGDPDQEGEDLAARMKADVKSDGTKTFTPLVAISLMIFVLLYFPCVATIIVIKNESGSWKYGIFTIVYTMALAWILSFAVYQIGMLYFN